MAHLLQSQHAQRRQHSMVRVVLGVLRALLQRSFPGDQWHLSPEQSLLLLAENTVIPEQVVIFSPKGTNNNTKLLFGTSFYDLKQTQVPPPADVIVRDGLRLYSTPAALVKVPQAFFARHPIESQVALGTLPDASDVLRRLLAGGHSAIAGGWQAPIAASDAPISPMTSSRR